MYMQLGYDIGSSHGLGESAKRFSIKNRPAPEARSRRVGGPTPGAMRPWDGVACHRSDQVLDFLSGRGRWVKHDTMYAPHGPDKGNIDWQSGQVVGHPGTAKGGEREKMRHVSPYLRLRSASP
jgi:hypothetical protein